MLHRTESAPGIRSNIRVKPVQVSTQLRFQIILKISHRQLQMPATIKSNSDLNPERSLTTEIGVGYQNENFSLHTNVFWTQNLGIISIDGESKLQNLYDAEVLGLDLGVVGIMPLGATRKLKFWAYASYLPWRIKDYCF